MKHPRRFALALARLGQCFRRAAPVPTVTLEQIERAEDQLFRTVTPLEIPVRHTFAPGVYLRTVTMPAGVSVIGHEHLTEHLNIVLSGRVRVLSGDRLEDITAPAVFTSAAGVRKVLQILEDTTWATVHPTHETDLATLETMLIRKSATYHLHTTEAARLSGAATPEAMP